MRLAGVGRRLFGRPVPPKLSFPPLDRLRDRPTGGNVREGVVVATGVWGFRTRSPRWVRALVKAGRDVYRFAGFFLFANVLSFCE
jgi:hypothetical protein